MTKERLVDVASRFGLMGALFAAAVALPACAGQDVDSGDEDIEEVAEVGSAIGETGGNDYPSFAVDSDPLKRSVTDFFHLTSSSIADPLQLCVSGSITSTSCTIKPEWKNWMEADATNRVHTMKAIAKCAVESTFSIQTSRGAFPGQWGVYPSWKSGRLIGQDKRERISSCTDPSMAIREGGFFGDLFAATPKAYVAGPDSATPALTGRACFATNGTYCCAEDDASCTHRIVLVGAIVGDPATNFANKRCSSLATSGSFQYCTSFFTNREPGRNYTNVFTTFVPELP